MTEPDPKATPKHGRRWRWRTALALLLTPFILALAFFGAIQTPWVKSFATNTAANMLGPMIGQEVTIAGLRGFIPFRIELDRFAMADAEGEWLTVEQVRLAWSWRALLGGRVVVDALSVDRVALPRIGQFPERPPDPEPEPFSLPTIPQLPGWIEVRALAVERAEIGEAIIQEDAAFNLTGALLQPGGRAPTTLDLNLLRLDAGTTEAGIHISLGQTALAVDIAARDDSILPRMLGLDGPAELTLRGDAPPNDWHGVLSASLGAEPLVDGPLGLRISERIDANARLTINTRHPLAPEAVAEQVGDSLKLVLDGRVDEAGRIELNELTALGDAVRVTVAGLLDLPGDTLDLTVNAHHDDLGPLVGFEPELGPQPVDAALHVTGSPADLAIDLDASWEGAPLAQGKVTLGLTGGLAIAADLRAHPPELFLPSAEAAALIADGIHVVADIPSLSGEHVRVARFEVAGLESLTLHGDADLDFVNGDGQADFVLAITALEDLAFLTGLDMAGAVELTAAAAGTGDRMDIEAKVSGDSLRFLAYAVGSLGLSLEGGLEGWADGDPRAIALTWEADAAGLALEPYPGEQLRLEGQLEAATLDAIRVPRVYLSDGVLEVEASGEFMPPTTSGSLTMTANAASFAPYGALMDTDLNGTARVLLQATLEEGGETGSMDLDADLRELTGLPDAVQGLVGSAVTAQANAALADGRATLHALDVGAANLTLAGAGWYELESGGLEGRATLALPDLAAAHAVLGPDASGSVRVEAEAAGTVEAITASARVRGGNVGAAGAHADELALDVTAEGLPESPRGRLTLTAVERGQQLDAEAAFALVDAVASATGVRLTLGGNRLDADGSYNLETGLPEASAAWSFEDLSAFEPFLGIALDGSIRGDLAITPEGGDASAALSLDAANIVAPFGSVESVVVSGSASTILGGPSGALNARLAALDAGEVRVDTLEILAEGGMDFVSFELDTAGNVSEVAPFELRITADAAPEAGSATIHAMDGQLERYPIALANPTAIAFNDEGLRLDPLVLGVGDGQLEARATQTAERVDALIEWSELPLGIANAFGAPEVSGTARGRVLLAGPLAEPELDASVEIVELRTALAIEPDAPSLDAAVTARLSPTNLDATARVGMSEETAINAEAMLPVRFSLEPFAFDIPEDATLDVRILGDLLLRDPLAFAGLVDHQFKGSLNLDYRVRGAPNAPDIQGVASMEGGRYENALTGTVLDAIAVRIDTNGADLVAAVEATDGSAGSLALNAEATLDPGAAFPFSVDGSLTDAVLVRRDDATVQLGGTLGARGDLDAVMVDGDFVVGPANIVLSIPRGGRIPEVEYIEVRGGIAEVQEDEFEAVGVDTPMEVTLNINTRFPNRVHIRGPGLESEWAGEIAVTGTAADPSVRGELRVLRGHLDLLDRRFSLTDSLIVLDGSTPPNPFINVRGQTRAAEVTAFVIITGTPDALNLRLESDPALPQDEVLSRVLFDRPIEEITPVQALQLARAAADLSGSLRGGSILGAGGGLLPFDRFDIQPDFEGTGETAIGAGAYVGDDIYVEVRQKIQSGTTAVAIDVELRRNLSVQGEVGSDGRTGAGVVYKRDY